MASAEYLPLEDRITEAAYVGPVEVPSPPTSGSSSSSLDGRSRRSGGSSDEEFEGTPLVRQEFRIGMPGLGPRRESPVTIPPNTPSLLEWNTVLRDPVFETLRQYNVQTDFVGLAYYPSQGPPNTVIPTILVRATARGTEGEWVAVASALRGLIAQLTRFNRYNFEIVDQRAYRRTQSYPVSDHDPIVSAWGLIEPEIVSRLKQKDWLALSVLKRGKPDGPQPTTVVLTVSENSRENWDRVRENLVQILNTRGFWAVAIQINRGKINYDGENSRAILSENDFQPQMAMGRSIGPRGQTRHPSSFGGFVRLTFRRGSPREYGLTCFHCVAPKDTKDTRYAKWETQGISPRETTSLALDAPSRGDIDETLGNWRHAVNTSKTARYRDIERRIDDPDEFVIPPDRTWFQSEKSMVVHTEQKIKAAQDFYGKSFLGNVYAASGLRVTDNTAAPMALDWALIDVSPQRISQNKLPSRFSLPPLQQQFSQYAVMGSSTIMSGLTTPYGEMYLYKVGRTTGFSTGQLNGVKTTAIHSWNRDANGVLVEGVTHALCIVPVVKCNSVFALPGDSGSFVFDRNGYFAGLYFGGDDVSGVGYMIGFINLTNDIKQKTGAVEVSFDC